MTRPEIIAGLRRLAEDFRALGLATGGLWRRVSEWTGDTTWNDTAQVIIGGSWTALAVVAAWQTRQVLKERAGRPSAPIWPDEEAS